MLQSAHPLVLILPVVHQPTPMPLPLHQPRKSLSAVQSVSCLTVPWLPLTPVTALPGLIAILVLLSVYPLQLITLNGCSVATTRAESGVVFQQRTFRMCGTALCTLTQSITSAAHHNNQRRTRTKSFWLLGQMQSLGSRASLLGVTKGFLFEYRRWFAKHSCKRRKSSRLCLRFKSKILSCSITAHTSPPPPKLPISGEGADCFVILVAEGRSSLFV